MSNIIDYTQYDISSTKQFNDTLEDLNNSNNKAVIDKLYNIIEDIINNIDMNSSYNSRKITDSDNIYHIHLDGNITGDIILLYTVNGKDITLDLKLYNITNHKNLSRTSAPSYTRKQIFHPFNVIENKYSQDQINFVEDCFADLIADTEFYKIRKDKKEIYALRFFETYIDLAKEENIIDEKGFLEIFKYIQNKYNKKILSSKEVPSNLDLSDPRQNTPPITEQDQDRILRIFDYHNIIIRDAYIITETTEYDDIYETMYVKCEGSDKLQFALLDCDLYEKLLDKFCIYHSSIGYGRKYEFSHYFEE